MSADEARRRGEARAAEAMRNAIEERREPETVLPRTAEWVALAKVRTTDEAAHTVQAWYRTSDDVERSAAVLSFHDEQAAADAASSFRENPGDWVPSEAIGYGVEHVNRTPDRAISRAEAVARLRERAEKGSTRAAAALRGLDRERPV